MSTYYSTSWDYLKHIDTHSTILGIMSSEIVVELSKGACSLVYLLFNNLGLFKNIGTAVIISGTTNAEVVVDLSKGACSLVYLLFNILGLFKTY